MFMCITLSDKSMPDRKYVLTILGKIVNRSEKK